MQDLKTLPSAVYLDLEWNCCDASRHRGAAPEIVEIGLVELDPTSLRLIREANYRVRPRQLDISLRCTTITGITRDDLLSARPLRDVVSKIAHEWSTKATCFAWGADEDTHAAHLVSEFIHCRNRRVDLAVQRFLCVCDSVDHIRELHPAHNHQIDVALRALTGTRQRAIYKCKVDCPLERMERCQKDVTDPDCLCHEVSHLGKDGASLVDAKESLRSQSLPCHQTGVDQLAQLSLHGPERNPGHASNLPQIVELADVAKQNRQHRTTRAPKQRA